MQERIVSSHGRGPARHSRNTEGDLNSIRQGLEEVAASRCQYA